MRTICLTIITLVFLAGSSAFAIDGGTVEFGADVAAAYARVWFADQFIFSAPNQFYVGVYLAHSVEFEGRIGYAVATSTYHNTQSATSLQAGVAFQFRNARTGYIPFLEFMTTLDALGGSYSQVGVGGGIGLKGHGHLLNPRIDASVRQRLSSALWRQATVVQLNIGLSLYSK